MKYVLLKFIQIIISKQKIEKCSIRIISVNEESKTFINCQSHVWQPIIIDEKRRITDICCCGVGVVFGVILFILACVLFSKNNLLRSNYPTDKDGHVCQLDAYT